MRSFCLERNVPIMPAYSNTFLDESRYLVLRGGAGSGKSFFCTQKFILRSFIKGQRFLVLRKYATTIGKSVYKLFCDVIVKFGLESFFTFKKSEYLITNKISGSDIVFSGLDDPEKIKSIAGVTSIWMEEANEFFYDDFKQLDLRLRDKAPDYRQIMITFNPIGTNIWIYKHFFEQISEYTLENTGFYKTTFKHNPSLPLDYIENLLAKKQEDPFHYSVYTLGEWGVLGERIYRPFETFTKIEGSIKDTVYGIDFGFNAPSALVRIDIVDDCYYVTEVFYETGLTNSDLVELMKQHNIDKKARIFCDHSEPDKITDLKRDGYNTYKAVKHVNEGINYIKSFHSKIKINAHSANLLKESSNYSYVKKADGTILDVPNKFDDHALDAMRYGIYSYKKTKTSLSY